MLGKTSTLLTVAVLALGTSSAAAQTDGSNSDGQALTLLVLIGICLVVYLLPMIVAFYRGHPNRWPILAINLVFGGTGIGWLGSLIWAFGAVHKSATGSDGGESGLNLFVNDPVLVRMDPLPDPVEQLARLKALLDSGALSDAEYESLRRPLVQRLVQGVK